MLVRQSVKVQMSISPNTVNFPEQLPNAFLQDLTYAVGAAEY